MSAIVALLGSLFPALLEAFKRREDRKQAEQAVVLAKLAAEKEIAIQTVQAQAELGQTQINATGPALKYISFAILHAPIVCALFMPDQAKALFENLAAVPAGFLQLVVLVNCAVWGLPIASNAITSIVSGIGEFAKSMSMARLSRKAIFEVVKTASGPMTQEQVNLVNKALDAANVNPPK